jgi:hypothetical protein
VLVKVLDIDQQGKIKLSRKEAMKGNQTPVIDRHRVSSPHQRGATHPGNLLKIPYRLPRLRAGSFVLSCTWFTQRFSLTA